MVVPLRSSGVAALRRLLVIASLCLGLGAAWSVTNVSSASEDDLDRPAVPSAVCGPGAHPETSTQGRTPKADYTSGRYLEGYLCNTAEVAHQGATGGFKTLRYTDA